MSYQLCDEFIDISSKHVGAFIVGEILSANYYSLILDFTSDVLHIDQLTLVLRYALPNGNIKQRFIKFIKTEEHTS